MVRHTVSLGLRINHICSLLENGAEIPIIVYQTKDEMNDFIETISLSAYLCCIDIEALCGILMPLSYAGLSFLNLLNIGRQ